MAQPTAPRLPGPASERLRPGLRGLAHRLLPEPEAAYQAMAPVAQLQHFRPLVEERNFYQEIGLLPINQVQLMSYVSAPVQVTLAHAPEVHLVATFAGSGVVRAAAVEVCSRPDGGQLLPPGAAEITCSDSSAVMALRPPDLARAAAAMAGEPEPAARGPASAHRVGLFAPRELSGPQAQQLHALMRHLDACAVCDPTLPERLGLDDVLLRLVVTWLLPELLQERPGECLPLRERAGASSFDGLIDYIRANLDQPLRLSELEARSHYSSRALQYAFRERLGCSPRQWIRLQRLERALEQLLRAGRGASIRAIALGCGYRHMGQFSSDFKRRYGLTPSAVLRSDRSP